MKEYLKKFESAAAADNYSIVDIPFATSIATNPIQNLVCNKTGKHLENDNGTVIIMPLDPAGPSANEIWYWGEYYDIENAISVAVEQGISYVGPTILSNEQVGNKYVITFDGPVTKLGGQMDQEELYPIFVNDSKGGITCNITRIEIPNSVTILDGNTFSGCASLTSVTIPNSVTNIGIYAFIQCTGLTSISIPNSVTNIEMGAFAYCSGLTSMIIPNSVTSIDDAAFYGCVSLTSVTCESTDPPSLGEGTFEDTNNCPIYVPAESVEAYKAATNWLTYASRIQAITQQP